MEYQRRDLPGIEKQVAWNLDQMYKERSGLNIQKDVYKKRDFCKNPETEAAAEPIIDKYGEELVEHKSLNLMN